jgi:hypothetical protein
MATTSAGYPAEFAPPEPQPAPRRIRVSFAGRTIVDTSAG